MRGLSYRLPGVLLACAAAAGAPARAENPETLRTYLESQLLDLEPEIDRIQELIRKGQWDAAQDRIVHLAARPEYRQALYPEDGREAAARYIPIRQFLYRLMVSRFPPDRLGRYRFRIDPLLSRALESAARGDLQPLRDLQEAAEVSPEFFRIQRILGDAEWERGAIALAIGHWQRALEDEPEPWKQADPMRGRRRREEERGLRTRLMAALAFCGRYTQARAVADRRLDREPPTGGVQGMSSAEWIARLPESDAVRGGPRPPLELRTAVLKGRFLVEEVAPLLNAELDPCIPAMLGNHMYVFDGSNLRAYDTDTGKLVRRAIHPGSVAAGPQAELSAGTSGLTIDPARPMHAVVIHPPSSTAYVLVRMATKIPARDGPRAFGLFGGAAPLAQRSSGELHEYDLNPDAAGVPLLKPSGAYVQAGDSPKLDLVGAPLLVGRAIYCTGVHPESNQLFLVRFDSESRREAWRVFLSASGFGHKGFPFGGTDAGPARRWPAAIAEAGGVIHVLSNRGAVVAVRADTGERLWAARYGLNVTQGPLAGKVADAWWAANPIVVHSGQVIVAPIDSREVVAYSAATGAKVWRRGQSQNETPFRHLTGPIQGMLFLVGGVRGMAVSVSNGELLGSFLLPAACIGRPAASGRTLYVPQAKGISAIDLTTLRTRGAVVVWRAADSPVGGNLILDNDVLGVASSRELRIYVPDEK